MTVVKGFEGDGDDDDGGGGGGYLSWRKWYGAGFWNAGGVEMGIYTLSWN